MKKIIAIVITTIMLSSPITNAKGIDLVKLGKEAIKIASGVTKASVDFRNETDKDIIVSMDSNREVYKIAAHGQATFGQAQIGEAPTFHVIKPDGTIVYSRKVGSLGIKSSSLGWNGKFF